jgi:rhodanese-related sulfurtransferase
MKASAGRALRWAAPLLILALLAAGCSRFHRQPAAPKPPYAKMLPAVAYEITRDNPGMLILDLRPAAEYNGETGHVRGARNIPLARLPYRLLEISAFREETVLVYCGNAECADRGMKILLASGFESAILMEGGIGKWIAEGFKTVLPANLIHKPKKGEPTMPARPGDAKPNPRPEVDVEPPPND